MALTMLATGCSDEGGANVSDDSAAWRTSTDPVTTSGLSWAAGSTVHLSDGTTIDTGDGFVQGFVVAGDGVFFVPADSEDEAGTGFSEELQFAAPGKPVTGAGVVLVSSFAASEDGRYLVGIDKTTGEKDRYGTPQAMVVAFDLETGEQVVDSTMGMGDPEEDDFFDAYGDAEMQILALTDTHLYVRTMDTLSSISRRVRGVQGRAMEEGRRRRRRAHQPERRVAHRPGRGRGPLGSWGPMVER